ncbi:MAG: DUF6064 family protein [Suilimivivens sp.]
MDAQAFWNVIGNYNEQTWIIQIILLLFVLSAIVLSYMQKLLLLFYLFYPFVSILLGNSFPQMVTYIMPCPVISLSIAVYAGYERKNKILLALLIIWD